MILASIAALMGFGFGGMQLLAAAATEPGLPLWGQLGVAAVFVVGFISGQIVPGYLYKRQSEDLKEERAYSRSLEGTLKNEVVPLMLKYVDTMDEVISLLRAIQSKGPRGRY
jgi:hypothetical protein